jgi:colanic acid/amylovoran biosynthesis protein
MKLSELMGVGIEELIMTNILLINTNCSWNKGSAAQVISTTETLRRLIPGANFTLISGTPEIDSKLCTIHNIKVVGPSVKNPFSKHSRLLKLFSLSYYLLRCALWSALCKTKLNVNKLLDEEVLTEYDKTDAIIDLSGDTLSDKGTYSVFSLFRILIGLLLKKKVTIYSQSIGPFKKITVPLARFCLNRANLIVVRENVTKHYLKDISVDNPSLYLAAEIAFLLEPAPPQKVREIFLKENINANKENSPLIGVGTSELMYMAFKSKNNVYVALMAKIADYLVEKLNAQVVFISHVIIPPKYGYPDDRFIAEKVYQLVRNKNRIKIIRGDYSPEELKGIIGRCDLFIGARMHSNIASTSMHVPTIALAWSHKYHGIMKMVEQEKYVCDIRTTTFNEIVSKINDAWSNRDEIREKLASKTTELEESAFHSGRLVKRLIKPISVEQTNFDGNNLDSQ